jgi:hypothetical protein
MASLSTCLAVEPVRSRGFATIGAGYMSVGDPIESASSFIVFQNLTDANVMVSFNGFDDNLPLPAAGGLVLDVTANKSCEGGFYVAEGTQFWVKHLGAAPTTGTFYITNFYGDEL